MVDCSNFENGLNSLWMGSTMSDDLLRRHPPERGRSARSAVVIYACCSSCCCLHTLGALLGAFLGGGLIRPVDDPGFDPERRIPLVHWLFDRLPRTQWVFWTSLMGVLVGSGPVVFLMANTTNLTDVTQNARDKFQMWGPGCVVVAWLLSVIRLALLAGGGVRPGEYWALHRALGWSLFGMLMGFALMGMLLGAAHRI